MNTFVRLVLYLFNCCGTFYRPVPAGQNILWFGLQKSSINSCRQAQSYSVYIQHHHHHIGATACFQPKHTHVDHTCVFVCPETEWSSSNPGRWVPILFAPFHKNGLQWGYYCSRPGHGNALMDTRCVWFEHTSIFSRKLGACHGLTHPKLRIMFDRQYKWCCSDNRVEITTHAKSLIFFFLFGPKFYIYLLSYLLPQSFHGAESLRS
jgi:hypothetical protein